MVCVLALIGSEIYQSNTVPPNGAGVVCKVLATIHLGI